MLLRCMYYLEKNSTRCPPFKIGMDKIKDRLKAVVALEGDR